MERDLKIQALLENYLSTSERNRLSIFKEISKLIETNIKENNFDECLSTIKQITSPTLDYTSAQKLCRLKDEVSTHIPKRRQKVKLAIISSFTTDQLKKLIELFLFAQDVDYEIYEAEYGVFRQEIIDSNSGLYKFAPKIVFIATSWRDLINKPDLLNIQNDEHALVEQEMNEWSNLWKTLYDRLNCQIIQNNFETPPWRQYANYEMRSTKSLGSFLTLLNIKLHKYSPDYVSVHDIEHLSSMFGKWLWADERFYHYAKLPCNPDYLVDYAHSVSSIISGILGLSKKCLVLDLDNTLWGGVIGDDGIENIKLGQGDPVGEAFLGFQNYIKRLKDRGIVLAVCSKNEEHIAKEVFEKHDDMALKLADIACFVANWEDKASNIKRIAKELDLSLDSFVFVDDNPAERSFVRKVLPAVSVPELPSDPTIFIRTIEKQRYFQVISVGSEDYKRTEFYKSNSERRKSSVSSDDISSFLKSLEMKSVTKPIENKTMPRSVQLINKSNQFNLTTKRYSSADVLNMMNSKNWITRTVTLTDRFGENGLISVLLAEIVGESLVIDSWLMSCRVLKRGVEHLLFNELLNYSIKNKLKSIKGLYIPTPKNKLVRNHYAELGFDKTSENKDGSVLWEIELSEKTKPLKHFIEEINSIG